MMRWDYGWLKITKILGNVGKGDEYKGVRQIKWGPRREQKEGDDDVVVFPQFKGGC
jgi:hypothetical protein